YRTWSQINRGTQASTAPGRQAACGTPISNLEFVSATPCDISHSRGCKVSLILHLHERRLGFQREASRCSAALRFASGDFPHPRGTIDERRAPTAAMGGET